MTLRRLLPLLALFASPLPSSAQPKLEPADFLLPDESKMTPFKDRVPVVFVTANQPEWKTLKGFWTETTQDDADPVTGLKLKRKVVKLKVPLGLTIVLTHLGLLTWETRHISNSLAFPGLKPVAHRGDA